MGETRRLPLRWWHLPLATMVIGGAIGIGAIATTGPCMRTGLWWGLWIDRCPIGDMRLGVDVSLDGVVRGGDGHVRIHPTARYVYEDHDDPHEHAFSRGFSTTLAMLDADGNPVEGFSLEEWTDRGSARVRLPKVPDGDYVLRVEVDAGFDAQTLDVPMPLYAPALAHVVSDRPLYKPGQEVLLRSVVLDRVGHKPLDGRPGTWRIYDPSGEELHRERDKAMAFGVSDTAFQLDAHASVGTWRAVYESGDATDTVTFDVRPFQLPRFTVELSPTERWFHMGDTVAVEGLARYTSGAPVAQARVEVQLAAPSGTWPLPLAWEKPYTATTDREGRFRVKIGDVPPEEVLRRELVKLPVFAAVVDAAGETARTATNAIVSQDDVRIDVVTELASGLVGGFNNRAYLRATTPDGVPMPGAELVVTNPWEAEPRPQNAKADVDGVAALQLDPGDPVSIAIPAPPVRPRPLVIADPTIVAARELISGSQLSMADRRALDRAVPRVAACGDFTTGRAQVSVALRVTTAGTVRRVVGPPDLAGQCVQDAMRGVVLPGGGERTLALTWNVPDTQRPSFPASVNAAFGDSTPLTAALNQAASQARRCVPRETGVSGVRLATLHWALSEGSKAVVVDGLQTLGGTGLSAGQLACVRGRLGALRLQDEATGDAMGVATLTLNVPRGAGAARVRSTFQTAYELEVVAKNDGATLGSTRVIVNPGVVPPLRLRATPSLAHPGEDVEIAFIRGPDHNGSLPTELRLMHGTVQVAKAKVDPKAPRPTFTVPADVDGFLYAEWDGARAVVFVRRPDPLAVRVDTGKPTYAPGETAHLTVTTTAGDRPVEAGVGLIGVDATLGQLATLVGPDDFGRVTVRATADEPAFGAFDPRALALGQVRGDNAAKAAVLRITQLPMDAGGDERLWRTDRTVSNDGELLTQAFYRTLEALVVAVRAWERDAPAGEQMTPERMASMWEAARTGLPEPARDAFGRPLTLDRLPGDLLALVAPREMVADGTRLPEDMVSWQQYVAQEVR